MKIIVDVNRLTEFQVSDKVRLIVQTVSFDFSENLLTVKNLRQASSHKVQVCLDLVNNYQPDVIKKGEIVDIEGIVKSIKNEVIISAFLIKAINGAILDDENFETLNRLLSLK